MNKLSSIYTHIEIFRKFWNMRIIRATYLVITCQSNSSTASLPHISPGTVTPIKVGFFLKLKNNFLYNYLSIVLLIIFTALFNKYDILNYHYTEFYYLNIFVLNFQ